MEGCKCTGCQVVKDITKFYKNNRSKTGKPRQPCKDCSKIREAEKRREYRENSKDIPLTKVCSVCLEEKSSEDFHKRIDTPTGLRSDCKDCYNNKSKLYYEDNAEKVIARTSEYQKIHREKLTRRKREKYQEDPESAREKDREWRRKNPDKVAQYAKTYRENNPRKCKESYRKYYYSNHKRLKERRQRWYQANKDKSAYYSAQRRAKKKQATPDWADQDVIKSFYLEAQYLGESVDHILPLSSDLVCGLHCEFNLQTIPLRDNIIKNNNFEICEHELPEFLSEEDFE